MKALKYLAVAAVITLGFTACEKKENNQAQVILPAEEAYKQLNFMSLDERLAMDRDMQRTDTYLKASSEVVGEIPDEEMGTDGISIIIAEWEGWGLAKYNCRRGFGFCNIEFFPEWRNNVQTIEHGSIVEYDKEKDEYYMDVMLASPAPEDQPAESFNLTVDNEIIVTDAEKIIGTDLVVKEGVYPLDPNVGVAGGYKIPFEKLSAN